MAKSQSSDQVYLAIILDALAVCHNYKPKFGKSGKEGFTIEQFRKLYHQDPFYKWMGLDSPFVYAAHKAAGGITSVYRQIGIACERLFLQVIQDNLGLAITQAKWSYRVPGMGGRERPLSLDGRIALADIRSPERSIIIHDWLREAAKSIMVDKKIADQLTGAVFEIRQGYKSKDSKRQNADIGNAANAYAHSYLPVVLLLSNQIDSTIEERYARSQWLILKGSLNGSRLNSTYAFFREVLAYDLAGFFRRNSAKIKTEIEAIIKALLQ